MTAAGDEIREVAGEQQTTGLLIYRASRLEKLLDPLVQLLAVTQPDNVLAPQTIIAAHPGMKQWLNGALARKYGAGGIAANLDILLPSAWIDRLAQQQLQRRAVSLPRYQRNHLRWSIHEMLAGDVAALGITDARIATYLHDDGSHRGVADQARRRFQLADRLARIYSQYLVYRPDWLRSWERGQVNAVTGTAAAPVLASTEQRLLAPLWKHLHKKLGAHRGDVVGELINQLGRVEATGEALHVFGVSHLAPSELAVLRAVARQRLVALYVPDPCREYWGGLGRTLPALRRQSADEQARLDAAEGNDYWTDQAHPLLSSWGRLGQHFIMELAAGEGDVLSDVRHREDEQAPRDMSRLQRVQQSIRALDPSLMNVALVTPMDAHARADASLRVHSCHTRLRELEVLRDQLLDALAAADANGQILRPADMVVMAPDIQSYVPLISAVFGVAGQAGGLLPYQLADVAVSRSHSLFGAFRQLLDLPGTRVTAPEVVDLLSVPEISRRLGLDTAGVSELAEWLKSSRVAWALDPAFRARFGVPPIAEHTFGWAMDRMIAGYVMADAADAERQPSVRLSDGTELAPLTGIHGPAAGYLGALDYLLREIQTLCDLADETHRASDWAVELERRFEALFRIDLMDRAARDAKAMVLGFIRTIVSEPTGAGEDPLLHFSVVRDLMVEQLSAVPEHQRFLMGGITFCGMVPQRAIPFKIVAVLGLNDGDFPRTASDAGLDLMTRYRRMGDRDVRSDDRYLFLETLMSAREHLHLSYVGEGVKDGKPRNPAPPLAELLAVLDAATRLRPDDDKADRPWLVRHPLQPFDARYFEGGDARLFSFNALLAGMHGRGERANVAPFLDHGHAPASDLGMSMTLRELHAYYRDPARQLLELRMQVSLEALEDDRLPQDEPIDATFSALDTVAKKLFFNDALPGWPQAEWPPAQAPDWLRLGGVMPPGRAGEHAWQQESGVVGLLLQEVAQLPGFERGAPTGASVEINLPIGPHRVTGQIANVYRTDVDGDEHWQLLRVFGGKDGKLKKEAELSFKERVPMFLDWALLRIDSSRASGNIPAVRLCPLLDSEQRHWQHGINHWDESFMQADNARRATMLGALEQRVLRLLEWWITAQVMPRWYFPKSAWATISDRLYRKKRAGKSADETFVDEPTPPNIGAHWIADHGGVGERDYAPGYSRLLAGDVNFAQGSAELTSLAELAMELHQCISFDVVDEVCA